MLHRAVASTLTPSVQETPAGIQQPHQLWYGRRAGGGGGIDCTKKCKTKTKQKQRKQSPQIKSNCIMRIVSGSFRATLVQSGVGITCDCCFH